MGDKIRQRLGKSNRWRKLSFDLELDEGEFYLVFLNTISETCLKLLAESGSCHVKMHLFAEPTFFTEINKQVI